jgi:hypothetical protein
MAAVPVSEQNDGCSGTCPLCKLAFRNKFGVSDETKLPDMFQ